MFFDIFAIHSSSRHEKRCQMSGRLFSLFRGSIYQQCTTKYAHFEALLMDYDLAMEGVREVGGYEAGTENKHVLYIQPDLQYPQVNQNIQCNAEVLK